jgi:hypothetical protein
VVPLSYGGARLIVHVTPESMGDVGDDGTIRLDRATVRWLERCVSTGNVVYDVHAGFGPYVLVAARQRGAVVVAFEPHHRLHAELCDNVRLNGCHTSVIAVPLALGSRDGLTTIDGLPSLCASRLETAVQRYGLPRAHHLRLSPRLAVLDLLEGAAATLSDPALQTVWLEVPTDRETVVAERLTGVGLQVENRRLRRRTVQMLFRRAASA